MTVECHGRTLSETTSDRIETTAERDGKSFDFSFPARENLHMDTICMMFTHRVLLMFSLGSLFLSIYYNANQHFLSSMLCEFSSIRMPVNLLRFT